MSGRYFVVVDARGEPHYAERTRGEAKDTCFEFDRDGRSPKTGPHTVVECIAMPKVTVRREGTSHGDVRVNGVGIYCGDERRATELARDLRRALRKGGGR